MRWDGVYITGFLVYRFFGLNSTDENFFLVDLKKRVNWKKLSRMEESTEKSRVMTIRFPSLVGISIIGRQSCGSELPNLVRHCVARFSGTLLASKLSQSRGFILPIPWEIGQIFKEQFSSRSAD